MKTENTLIILTQKKNEGLSLKSSMAVLDPRFSSIPTYIKEDIINNGKSFSNCEYIFSTWYMPVFSVKEIEQYFPNLKAIFYAAGTVKSFAEPFLSKGIRVFSASEANGIPVAEYAVSQIILANKGYFKASRNYKWPMFSRRYLKIRREAEAHSGNYKSTVGLLGCGAVGSSVVKLLHSYDVNILVYDPFLSEDRVAQLGVTAVGLKTLFTQSDTISNHLPDISETKGLIDKEHLSLMKPYATIINTGRGAQINESDLAKVLRRRKDLTAILDVTSHEPLYPWSSLYCLNNIFFSPHLAGSTGGEVNRMVDYEYRAYLDFIGGKQPHGEVLLSQLKTKA